MKNKLLIKVYIPALDENFEIFIPTNDTIKKVVDLIIKSVNELSDEVIPMNDTYCLLDPLSSKIYDNSLIIRDTDIVNDKKIMLI